MTTTMTTLFRRAFFSTGIGLVTCLLGTAVASGPSRDLSTYVLFGDQGIRARGFRIDRGDVGVNQGGLRAHDAIDGPDSTLAGDVVSVGGRSRCAELFFTTAVTHAAPSCGPGTSYVGPLIADLQAACGVPDDFPDCNGGASVDVAAGDERTLPPGVYGDVDVGGAASRHGHLVLTGGRYVFCSLRTRRGSVLEADSAAQVFVAGDVRIGPKSSLGPAEDLDIFTRGSRFSISRAADVGARVCALDGTLQVTDGATLTGRFVAGQVIAGRIKLAGLETQPSTTTTSSTSSTTSSTSSPSTTSSSTTSTSAASTTSSTTATSTTTTSSTTTSTATSSTSTTSSAPGTTTTSTSGPSTTTLSSSTTTSSAAPTTTTSSTSTSSSAPSTTTTSTSAPQTTTPSSSTTTSTAAPTTTTSSTAPVTTSTTTTMPSLSACPAGGQVDVITTLVPDIDTFSSGQVGGIEVDLGYPASVSMPGTQFLPVNDPTDPATLIALLSATPGQINLYDGLQTFFDADSAAPFALRTVLTLNPTANLIFNQAVPFERARFSCTPGAGLSVNDFTCTIPQEVNAIGGTVPESGRPPCVLTLAAP
jgi:hypothetical protein